MDEVKAMTNAGETVGRAVGTGLRTLRLGAVQVAAAAEQKLADSADTVRGTAAETQAEIGRTSRRARKQLVKDAKVAARDLARDAKRVRKHAGQAARDIANAPVAAVQGPKRGRKWPWLVGVGVAMAGAGAVYVLRSRQQDGQSAQGDTAERAAAGDPSVNGSAPAPQGSQHVDSSASH